MRSIFVVTLIAIVVMLANSAFSQQQLLRIRQLMTAQEFKAAGLEKLTPAEFQVLEQWFNRYAVHIYQLAQGQRGSAPTGQGCLVENAVNDETFIINSNVYKAKTYYMSLDRGDRVIFIEGSPNSTCVSAKLMNLRNGDICEV